MTCPSTAGAGSIDISPKSDPAKLDLVDGQVDAEAALDRSGLMARVRYMVDDVDDAVAFYACDCER